MRQLSVVFLAALLPFIVFSCRKPGQNPPAAAPEITWEANPDFSVMELEPVMDVNLHIDAPAGIKALHVKVTSATLAPVISQMTSDGSSDMDLIGDLKLISALSALLSDKAFPMGDELKDQVSVDFSLSELVPMILALQPEPDSEHIFTLTVTDNEDREAVRDLKFHYTGEPVYDLSAEVSEIDLWKNTARITVTGLADGMDIMVRYREKGSAQWIEADASGKADGVFTIAPEWTESVNGAGLTVYSPEEHTGIFACRTYEAEITDRDGKVYETLTFVSSQLGDEIPNSDMSGWTEIGSQDKPLPYPNAQGDSLWTSGNNVFNYPLFGDEPPVFLCSEDNGRAYLQATKVMGAVFAAGNLFLGEFSQAGTAGEASFGQCYAWSARPKALRVTVKAHVDTINSVGANDPLKEQLEENPGIDKARIYVSVMGWNGRHVVKSGLGVNADDMNVWDPALQTSTQEGNILGYASVEFDESHDDFVTVEIPLVWYDTQSKPSEGSFSLGIACCTSSRGDYLTGCSENKMWVDDFVWVY